MKNVKKLIALGSVIAMTMGISALAEDTATYDNATNTVTLSAETLAQITDDTQWACVIIPEGVSNANITAGNIVYINQGDSEADFWGNIKTKLEENATELAAGTYVVRCVNEAGTTVEATFTVEQTAQGPKVTFVNGAEKTEVNAVGTVVTLPATPTMATTTGYLASGYVFDSWVLDGDKAFDSTNVTEDTTVYAKYKVQVKNKDALYGDANGDSKINAVDTNYVNRYFKQGTVLGNTGKNISPLTNPKNKKLLAGDASADAKVNAVDTNYVNRYFKQGTVLGSTGKTIYVINK